MKKEKENRCEWAGDDLLMQAYHDCEWGTPLHDEDLHFEFLLLETMQAGLSWKTILHKRENFRKAFDAFDPRKITQYDDTKRNELLSDAGIIRNKRKIEAAIHNAGVFLEIQKEYGTFDAYIWNFTDGKVVDNPIDDSSQLPTKTELSDNVSKEMKKKGFKFVGSVTIYAHLQAIGVINDHEINCQRGRELRSASE